MGTPFYFYRLLRLLSRSLVLGILFLLAAVTHAQITLDGSLGPKGPLTGPDYTIGAEVGQLRGNNLFHSFGQFNVHTDESATFTGPSTVENVIGRVTGGQQSLIDGRIRSEMPQANMYLLNPSGVLFGPNATLDVNGSFHVSTADYLRLGDNGRFDATTPSNSVLTSAPPSAFGFLGSNPAPITIQGSSLQVPEGKTLSVIGGDIQLTGGTLAAQSGQITLASVASAGEVVPAGAGQEANVRTEGFGRLGKIEVSQGAHISADGESEGSVVIRGGRLIVSNAGITADTQGDVDGAQVGVDLQIGGEVIVADGGVIKADVTGSGNGGNIQIKASSVESGSSAEIRSIASSDSTGKSGNIELQVGRLTLTDGAQIVSTTHGTGDAGTVSITATDSITITGRERGGVKDPRRSGVVSDTFGSGNAGQVKVSAPTLALKEGGAISAVTNPGSTGKAGEVEVTVGRLTLTDGGRIFSTTHGTGDAGTVTVTATDSITIAGRDRDIIPGQDIRSKLTSSTEGSGNAGQVKVSAPTLVLEDGGQIEAAANTGSSGTAGEVGVTVGRLTLTGGARIVSTTKGIGNAGTVTVTATDSITIAGRDASRRSGLTSNTTNSGNAGQVKVSAPTLILEDGGVIQAIANPGSTGKGGEVGVTVGRLTLTGGAQISSTTRGTGRAGTVKIIATDSLTIAGRNKIAGQDGKKNPSGVVSDTDKTATGQGGDIDVQARHIVLSDDGEISATSSGSGDAGTLQIHAQETFRSRNGSVTTAADQAGGGKINLSAGQMVELVNSKVTTSVKGGSGDAGNITIDPRFVILNDSRVIAQAVEGNGGNIRIGADVFLASPTSVVDASSQKGISGTIDIRGAVNNLSGSIAPLPQGYLSTAALVNDRCAGRLREGQASSFVVAGRDGMPLQPGGVLPSPLYEASQIGPQSGPTTNPAFTDSTPASAVASPEVQMAEGRKAFQQGAFEQAVLHWREATRLYEQAAQPEQQSEALTHLAQADQALGQYQEVFSSLTSALALAKQAGDQTQIASVLHSLGNAYIATGSAENAYRSFNEALGIAKQLQTSELSAAILNDLGNLYTIQKRYPEALAAYRESLTLAQTAGNQALVMRAQINAATASLQNGQYPEAETLLDRAADQSQKLEPSHDTAYGLVTIGVTYRTLHAHLPDSNGALSQHAFNTLSEAARIAENINDQRAASYAWGYLGTLYEDERRYQDALQLTRRAIFAAQQINTPESLYRWQWQAGRVLKALGQVEEAITAYRGAVSSLQAIRQGMSVNYGSTQTSFRESVGPVYFELVDLLLQRAASLPRREQYESYLSEARETVELLRAAELRDYFHDDCVDATRSRVARLDVVSQTAVVVYPIILPDRIELLVSLPGGLKRFTVPVSADTLTQEVRHLRSNLEKRTTRQYLPHAQHLYDWLIRPLEPDLASVSAETLVFVPDGPLRTIPMAALHDGTQFLISKYAVATTPGLDLTDPRPLKREATKVLAAGLTESVQGFPPLPYVSTELQAVQHLYGGKPLLNNSFLTANVEKESKEQPFSIVHIASHGYFAGEVEKSFLLTFDDKLTMDRLSQVVGLSRLRETPLELLTLSACETAAGDDRAALGLAGVAIKAGARSALATLWTVDDEASAVLVAEFYQQLQDASVSRAVALQRAQQKLLADPRHQHPMYWSPFLLLNNWL